MNLPNEFNPSKETVDHHNRVLESLEYKELLEAAGALRTVLSFYICGGPEDTSPHVCEAADVFDAVVNGDGNKPWMWAGPGAVQEVEQ